MKIASAEKEPGSDQHIEIIDSKTIQQIQEEFTTVYPYLKIEFFTRGHRKQELTSSQYLIPHSKQLLSIRRKRKEGVINIPPFKTVAQVEEDFEKNFGLHVQVFRRSGNVWIETSLTDNWTLGLQNREGLEISRDMPRFSRMGLHRENEE